jgi:glutamate/tyrosine decarboxylase-like PLP-dependent enzyme
MDRYSGVNFADRGIELSRPFRALKVWLTVKTFGLREIRAALDRSLDLGALAARLVDESPRLELVTGPSLGVVNFRSADGVPVERMMAEVISAGAYISATTVGGERTARICALGHRSDEAALTGAIEAAAGAH